MEESSGKMGIAMLCLLYCSRCGLTEVELLEMLGTLEEPTEQGDCKGLSLLSVCVCANSVSMHGCGCGCKYVCACMGWL